MICISNSTNGHAGPPDSTFVPDAYLHVIGTALWTLQREMRNYKP